MATDLIHRAATTPAISSMNSAVENARQVLAAKQMLPSEATKMAELLTDRWPQGRPPNYKAYLAGLGEVLVRYPREVALDCCDMNSGLPSRLQFLPTGRDVKEFCEARLAYYKTVGQANPARISVTVAEAERRMLPPPAQSPAERATMMERMRALINHLAGVKAPTSTRSMYLEGKREAALTKGGSAPLPAPGAEEAA